MAALGAGAVARRCEDGAKLPRVGARALPRYKDCSAHDYLCVGGVDANHVSQRCQSGALECVQATRFTCRG